MARRSRRLAATQRRRHARRRRAAARALLIGRDRGADRGRDRRRRCFEKAMSELGAAARSTQSIIRQQAAAKHLDPALVAAVIYAETQFDARTSPTGAEGLMQIEPATAEFLARRSGGIGFTVSDLWHARGQHRLRQLLPALPARTSTTAARCWRWPPTTAARPTSSSGFRGGASAPPRVHDRGHPVPRRPGLRRAGAVARARLPQDVRAPSSATADAGLNGSS